MLPTDSAEMYHIKAIKCELLNKKAYSQHYNLTGKTARDTEIFNLTMGEATKFLYAHMEKLVDIVGKEKALEILEELKE